MTLKNILHCPLKIFYFLKLKINTINNKIISNIRFVSIFDILKQIKIEKIINKETEYPFIPSLMFIAFNSNKNESIVKKIDKLSNQKTPINSK